MNALRITPIKPRLILETPMALLMLIPTLIIYWCPTSAVIWTTITEGAEEGVVNYVIIAWGLLATYVIMYCLLRVIRCMEWTRLNSKQSGK